MPSCSVTGLWTNACIATMQGAELGLIARAALAIKDDTIVWVGPMAALPPELKCAAQFDCAGALITPGLIDCHTHLVFAGNRADEFALRLGGASYEDMVQAGGGILSTVRETRDADEGELFVQSERRVHALMREGVTTLEIKSGYGLDIETELKMLRVARRLGERNALTVKTTFLGAHAVPPEFSGRADAYVDYVCNEMLPAVVAQGLADAVDAFCENIAFTPAQTRRIFEAARRGQLPVKLHAEQRSNQHGAELAAEFAALSADHLEFLDERGVTALANSGTVAVLLPGAFYFLRETRLPPIAALRERRIPIAVASDLNPGTSPIISLLANMHMAATQFRLTPVEVLRAVTVNAARALGLDMDRGVLAAGMRADFCVWDTANGATPAELCYWMGGVKPGQVIFGGKDRNA
jgi:imidazolonepropionase